MILMNLPKFVAQIVAMFQVSDVRMIAQIRSVDVEQIDVVVHPHLGHAHCVYSVRVSIVGESKVIFLITLIYQCKKNQAELTDTDENREKHGRHVSTVLSRWCRRL